MLGLCLHNEIKYINVGYYRIQEEIKVNEIVY